MHNTLRVAGWATLGFSIAFFVTFVVNAVINTLTSFPDIPTASDMESSFVFGVVFMMLWGTAGVALVVAAIALPAVVWPDGGLDARISSAFGVIAAAGWIFAGVAGFAQRTWLLNDNIIAAGTDPAAEKAIVEGLYIGVHIGGVLFAFAALPWLAIVAVGAARHHSMSRVAIVFLWIAAIASLAGFVITGAQYGFLVVLVAFAVVGVSLLRRARKTARGESPVAVPAPATAA